MSTVDLKQLEWSSTSFKISELLQKFSLPQIVKVIEGFYGEDEESSLGADQVMSLHLIKSTDKICGHDYRGKEVSIPLYCRNKVEVRPSDLKDIYESVEELWLAFPRYARVSQGYYSLSNDEEILNVGDKLQLKSVDKSRKGDERLVCVNQNGQTVELSKDCVAGFQPLSDGKEYYLAEVVAQFTMPLYVQFIDPPSMGKETRSAEESFFNSSLGPIYLQNTYTENVVIASTISQDGDRTVVTFPRDMDIRLAVCEGMLRNSADYSEICESLNAGMQWEHLKLIDAFSAFKPRNSVREYPYKQLLDPAVFKHFYETDSTGVESNDTHVNMKQKIPEVKEARPDVKEARSEVKEAKPETKELKSERKEQKPDVMRQASSDYENVKWIPGVKENSLHGEQVPAKPLRQQQMETELPETIDNSDLSKRDGSTIPRIEVTIQQQDGKKVEPAVSSYTVKQVSEMLKELGMDKYIVKFESEKIDGEMLTCLDDDILMTDFGMNKLHCMKLKKYLEGWRPKV